MSESAYPLYWPTGWPRTEHRQDAMFRTRIQGTGFRPVTVSDATQRLMSEIRAFTRQGHNWRIDPDHVVISTNLSLRRDGFPRSDQGNPTDPGAAVYFSIDEKRTVLACDKWRSVADNIAAIAAHLGALRGQERWGVGTTEQAFAGYVALNEKTQPSCFEILGISTDATELQIMDAYRRKARETHPDAGGSSEAFSAVVRAKDIALQHNNKVTA